MIIFMLLMLLLALQTKTKTIATSGIIVTIFYHRGKMNLKFPQLVITIHTVICVPLYAT